MEQVFVSWSGGKDCSFACYKAMANGLRVRYLLNMATEDGKMSWTHGLSSEVLQIQSQAIGIPLVQRQTVSKAYEASFVAVLQELKRKGVTGGVFGDIDMEEHREWVERVCHQAGFTAHLPLWGQDQEKLLGDYIASGFEAVLVAAKADLFGEEWLGRRIDQSFVDDLNELRKTKEITPCGEAGEYHTFVIDGPFFRQRVAILETNKTLKDGQRFLEILKCDLKPR